MRMNQTFKAYNAGVFAVTRILIPAWIVHYYVKYHVSVSSVLLYCLIYSCTASIEQYCNLFSVLKWHGSPSHYRGYNYEGDSKA